MAWLNRKMWVWLRPVIGLAILGALVWRLGAASFLAGLRAIDPSTLAAALVIGLATTVLCAWRWCIVANRLGLRLALGPAIADYYRALFLNAVLPAGMLGDVHRAVRHGKQEGDLGRGVRAVVLERVAGQVVIVGAAVAVLLTGTHFAAARNLVLVTAAAVAVLALVVVALRRWAHRDPRLHRTLRDVRVGLLARDAWPSVALLSAATLAGHVGLFLVAAHAAGATAPVAELVPLLVIALLAMGLPINIGGWGPREGMTAVMFGAAGLGSAQGLTTAVVYGMLALVASLPGAWVLFRRAPAPRQLHGQEATG